MPTPSSHPQPLFFYQQATENLKMSLKKSAEK